MNTSSRLLVRLAVAVLLAAAAAPLVKLASDAAVQRTTWARRSLSYEPTEARRTPGRVTGGEYEFGRVFRLMLLAFVIGALAVQTRGGEVWDLLRRGYAGDPRAWRRLGRGLELGFLSVAFLALVLWMLGRRYLYWWEDMGPWTKLARKLVGGVGEAAAPGLIEETVFRAVLLGALLRERRPAPAIAISALVYAAFHLFDGEVMTGFGVDPAVGVRTAFGAVAGSLRQPAEATRVLGLLAIGAVLGLAFARSGSVYLCVGLHTGWVFAIKALNVFTWSSVRKEDYWFFGSRWMLDGLLVWVMAPALAWDLWRLTRPTAQAGPRGPQ